MLVKSGAPHRLRLRRQSCQFSISTNLDGILVSVYPFQMFSAPIQLMGLLVFRNREDLWAGIPCCDRPLPPSDDANKPCRTTQYPFYQLDTPFASIDVIHELLQQLTEPSHFLYRYPWAEFKEVMPHFKVPHLPHIKMPAPFQVRWRINILFEILHRTNTYR